MSLWRQIQGIYAPETLDTRFVTSSSTPVKAAATTADSDKKIKGDANVAAKSRPSKWGSPEYYFYYFIFITIVPLMFYVPYSVSRATDSQYSKFEPLLSEGWIFGRKVDNSDQQYASFRDNIPYMAVVVVIHPLLRTVFEWFYKPQVNNGPEAEGDARQKTRITYDLLFAGIFTFVLHGFSAFKVILVLFANYTLAKKLPREAVPVAAWVFNMAILFSNELCEGYRFTKIAEVLLRGPFTDAGQAWGHWLDSYGGLVPRWEVLFNITVLRLISFDLDYYWALGQSSNSALELNPANLSERDRVSVPCAASQYNFANYLAYSLYSPLYLAGPILTFNDFISQVRYRLPSVTRGRTIFYGLRFLFALLGMELLLHYMYVVAISKSNPDWGHYTPFQLSMLGFFNLHIIWLKLLLPWRFFRLWALLDGVDPPENMVRCMSNNYSASQFWRGWHRSFNRWLIRYIFVPLGGSGGQISKVRSVANMLIVFMFVALWHDINARLLAWSWLIVLFLLPEIVCTMLLFPRRKYKEHPETYRMLSGVGAVGNILMMMAANLVGFALGLDGLQQMVNGIVSGWQGWAFLVAASATLYVGVMVMFEWREDEMRRGIDLKC